MGVEDYSNVPDENVAVNGINIAEGMPPGLVNNAIRQIMADLKNFYTYSVRTNRKLTTIAPLFGGGDLSEDRAFSIAKATLAEMGAIQLASQQEAKDGVDEFKAITPLTLKASFTQSMVIGQSGWQRLPSGLIFQWGKVACAERANTNVIFPVSFPTGCVHIVGIGNTSAGNTQAYVTVNTYDKAGAIFNCFTAVSGQVPVLAAKDTVQVWYFALGF